MRKSTVSSRPFQALVSKRLRQLAAGGLLTLVVGVPAYLGAASLASAHTTVAPSHVITPLDSTPPVPCSGAMGPC